VLLLLSLAKYPELTPAQVRELLFDRAKDLGEVGFDADSGYGALQAEDIYCT
jgi:hypothetical protein